MNTINYLGIDINLEDAEVWKFLSSAKNLKGVFQLETNSSANVLRNIQPKNMEDLSLVNSLNRPGAIKFVNDITKVRNGEQPVKYIHESLEPFLKSTNGFLVYQEQVMQIAQKLAGFDAKSSNILLKALGKKDEKKMQSIRVTFIEGMKKNNIPEEAIVQIFQWFVAFADYSFNRSHSMSYSIMGYISAYIKYHNPTEFFCSVMNYAQYEQKPIEEVAECVSELPYFKINILPPSIDRVNNKFVIENKDIRYPLGKIKGLGEAFYEKLKSLTESHVSTLESCLEAMINVGLNSRSIESIIICGGLDKFGIDREHILFYYWFLSDLQPEILERFWTYKSGNQFSKRLIFKFLNFREVVESTKKKKKGVETPNEMPTEEKIRYKSYFKTETTRINTLTRVKEYLTKVATFRKNKEVTRFFWETHALGYSYYNKFSPNIRTYRELDTMFEGDFAVSCGFVDESKFRISQKGNSYAILTLKFDTKKEFMLFGEVAAGAKDLIKDGDFVKFKAEMMKDKLKIESINVINQERQKYEFYTKI